MPTRSHLPRRMFVSAAVASAALPQALRAADQNTKTTLRFGAYLAPVSHTVTRIINPWIKGIESDSQSRIGFDLYTGGSLGRSPYAQFDLLRAGVADVAFVQPPYTTGQFKQLQILETPLLVRNSTEASLVAWELYRRGLVQGFEDVHVLGFWTAEPGVVFSRLPVSGLDDLKNLKVRSAGRLEGDFIESLGATAESMHPTDVYEALRRHTIDATVQGLVAVNTFQAYRVSTHVINAPFGVVSFALLMNKRAWEKLPTDLQEVITLHSGQRLSLLGGNSYDTRVAEIDKKFRANPALTYVEPSAHDIERLQDAVKPLVDAWVARTPKGAETYEAVKDILANMRSIERPSGVERAS
ncbi:MAG: TRAP transporter substrate-binding protein [Rhodospirillaceae bacterium]|nr:TRAP transporter substrate-binding protein [Rhodospirillaceae bacterium]